MFHFQLILNGTIFLATKELHWLKIPYLLSQLYLKYQRIQRLKTTQEYHKSNRRCGCGFPAIQHTNQRAQSQMQYRRAVLFSHFFHYFFSYNHGCFLFFWTKNCYRADLF